MKRYILGSMVLIMFIAGCSGTYMKNYVQPQGVASEARHLAVLPLVNLTNTPNAGRMVSDLLSTELYSSTKFDLMESTEMLKRVKGEEDDLEFVMEDVVAQKIGNKLGVDTVVFGSVSEYQYKRGVNQSPTVGINLKMIDVSSGNVLWASSSSKSGGCFFGCTESLNSVAQETLAEMVESMSVTPAQ
ncbi:CsgG/HfaB family protein [Maridesulfovibrio hydrothermalis]|uniref:Putative lipoprotein n=1 Tax=Maridesulfovibrio hydrothermalis AM13 = DSM 14728 TaxID=1121451 RepID=L0RD23_9BACT|nr:CsgG/HfaB family protein [Maridesulfovibrio hydrothermalis]CCO24100.1 putative lipoprotein [Maridesulfovibrio hydrothermalis AM13 = DSM 14728]